MATGQTDPPQSPMCTVPDPVNRWRVSDEPIGPRSAARVRPDRSERVRWFGAVATVTPPEETGSTWIWGTLVPYVAAGASVGLVVTYLAVWGGRYGLDLHVYRDSVSYWTSGHNPYQASFSVHRLEFTYPPFALVALSPLHWASFTVTQWLMWAASITAATVSVALVLFDRGFPRSSVVWCAAVAWSCLSVILFEPVRSGIDYGQIELVLLGVVVVDLLAVPERFRGIGIGLVSAVKLTPLVFVVLLAVRRDWRSVFRALVSFAVLTLGTWLLWPTLSRLYWRHDVSQPSRTGTVTVNSNQSWYAVLHRPPFPATGAQVVWVVLSLITLVVATFVAWRCTESGRRSPAMAAVALAGLLVSPISWSHHWAWVLLLPAMLIGPRRSEVARVVRFLLWTLVGLCVLGPYGWFSSGAAKDVMDAVVPVWTFATLVTWAGLEWTEWRSRVAPPGPAVGERRSGTPLSDVTDGHA